MSNGLGKQRRNGAESAGQLRAWRLVLLVAAVCLTGSVIATHFELAGPQHWVTRRMMQGEDVPVLLPMAAMFAAFAIWPGLVMAVADTMTRAQAIMNASPALWGFAVAAAATAFVGVGTGRIALNYPYSRDEAMAVFDTAILASGRLIAPVPVEWRSFISALQPEFRLEVPGNVAWVSSYLPGNAAIRAASSTLGGGNALTNAALLAVSLAALVGLTHRWFPNRSDARVVALIALATSSQVLFMAMTPYAMAAHLALNLVWLWLFSLRTVSGHVGAIAVGFLATGLHQIFFHPLFIAPFLLQLVLQRRWTVLAVYVPAYAAIGLFWIGYWQWLLTASGIEQRAAAGAGFAFLISRVMEMLGYFNLQGAETMLQNVMRYAAWQNPLVVALGGAGIGLAFGWKQSDRLPLDSDTLDQPWWPLALGIVFTLLVMFLLLPYQATGWGYRYVHGLMGSIALLTAFAWVRLVPQADGPPRRFALGFAATSTIVAVAVLIPLHAWNMHATHAPYARAANAIARTSAPAVFIDTTAIVYGNDLVRNAPDLSKRPLVFDFGALDEAGIRELCRRFGTIARFSSADAVSHGIEPDDPTKHQEHTRIERMWQVARGLQCVIAMPLAADR